MGRHHGLWVEDWLDLTGVQVTVLRITVVGRVSHGKGDGETSQGKLGWRLDHAGGGGGARNIQILGPLKAESTALASGWAVSCGKKRT